MEKLLTVGEPTQRSAFLNEALSCYSSDYTKEGTDSQGIICYELYPAGLFKETTILMRGKGLDDLALSYNTTLTNQELESLKEEGNINPQKVIKYLFSVAYDLLASDDAKP